MYNLLEMLGKAMEFMLLSRSAVYGNGPRLLPVRALLDSSINSMALPNISKRLYMRWTNPCAHSNYLNFASIKNPHPFHNDCIISSDH